MKNWHPLTMFVRGRWVSCPAAEVGPLGICWNQAGYALVGS